LPEEEDWVDKGLEDLYIQVPTLCAPSGGSERFDLGARACLPTDSFTIWEPAAKRLIPERTVPPKG
jgi:hypothetical protein